MIPNADQLIDLHPVFLRQITQVQSLDDLLKKYQSSLQDLSLEKLSTISKQIQQQIIRKGTLTLPRQIDPVIEIINPIWISRRNAIHT